MEALREEELVVTFGVVIWDVTMDSVCVGLGNSGGIDTAVEALIKTDGLVATT